MLSLNLTVVFAIFLVFCLFVTIEKPNRMEMTLLRYSTLRETVIFSLGLIRTVLYTMFQSFFESFTLVICLLLIMYVMSMCFICVVLLLDYRK